VTKEIERRIDKLERASGKPRRPNRVVLYDPVTDPKGRKAAADWHAANASAVGGIVLLPDNGRKRQIVDEGSGKDG
jgi:hypothetical protein